MNLFLYLPKTSIFYDQSYSPVLTMDQNQPTNQSIFAKTLTLAKYTNEPYSWKPQMLQKTTLANSFRILFEYIIDKYGLRPPPSWGHT